jgi:hypothetical protein
MRMSRARAVREWTRRAIDKYFLGFIFPDRISSYYGDYEPFFYAQGLEMVCKAYLIGTAFPLYRDKSFAKAKKEIDRIARGHSHDLGKLVKELISLGVIPIDFLDKVHYHDSINNVDITNQDMLKTLWAVYLEARYPVAKLDYQRHYEEKIKGNPKAKNKRIVSIPKMSHEVGLFNRKLFTLILKSIENDFRLKISREKLRADIDDNDWERFSNLFFRYG